MIIPNLQTRNGAQRDKVICPGHMAWKWQI